MKNPVPLAAARALRKFNCSAALNTEEIAQAISTFQSEYLVRRHNLTPPTAALVASLAFGQRGDAR
jgi:hypothetical protein